MSDDDKSGIKFGDLKKMIGDTVKEIMEAVDTTKDASKDDKTADAKDSRPEGRREAGSVREAVVREIENIRRRDAEEKEKANLTKTVNDLKEKTKEKPPVERRRVHKFMGWGENAD